MSNQPTAEEQLRQDYLDLLKIALSNKLYPRQADAPVTIRELRAAAAALERARLLVGPLVAKADQGAMVPELEESRAMLSMSPDQIARLMRVHTPVAHTLLSDLAIDNVQSCVEHVLRHDVPGDLMECGVWRGGMTIFIRGLLRAWGDRTRKVWAADSFQGLPAPDPDVSPADAAMHEYMRLIGALSVSLEDVKENFRRYRLLDGRVKFLPGWFADTLPTAPVQSLAVLRLDGDYYESTRVALQSLYPRVSVGGFIIIDDYYLPLGARRAVDEYRNAHSIRDDMDLIDAQVVCWQKSG